ncbi:MAG TPA: FGGY family carbohydrate kinase, partial [Oscillospiraceae bacterium]|nr:FGGY family carbohydrate kinase [Oscillospiraceae bacterium]
MYLIGLDIGTTTVSAVLVERATRNLIKAVTLENNAFIKSKFGFERAQDPEIIYTTVKDALFKLSVNFKDVSAIGVTGQMHGIVYCDENGKHISPLYTWQDGRGNESYKDATYSARINEKTGYKTASGFGLVTH